jgi:predicted molibdopterin-dependent oxidoreductase YjgC
LLILVVCKVILLADAEMHGITNNMPIRGASRGGEIVLRATITEKTTMGVVFIFWHFAKAAANLLTYDALDLQAKILEFKACAVQVFSAKKDELANCQIKAVTTFLSFI